MHYCKGSSLNAKSDFNLKNALSKTHFWSDVQEFDFYIVQFIFVCLYSFIEGSQFSFEFLDHSSIPRRFLPLREKKNKKKIMKNLKDMQSANKYISYPQSPN